MNPLTQIRNQNKINELEIKLNSTLGSKSWHHKYIGSAWVYIGGLSYELNEGDVICVFSQYGEVVNINLIRDKKTGKSKGFAFLCYADQRSTILAVDNFNGIKLCGRIIRVDHIEKYRPPEDFEDDDEIIRVLKNKGCGPDVDFNLIQTTKETDAKKERCNTPSKDVRQSTLKETHSSKLNNKYNRRSNATDKEQSRCNIAKWIESTKPRDGTPRMSDQKDKREMLFRNKHRSISPTRCSVDRSCLIDKEIKKRPRSRKGFDEYNSARSQSKRAGHIRRKDRSHSSRSRSSSEYSRH